MSIILGQLHRVADRAMANVRSVASIAAVAIGSLMFATTSESTAAQAPIDQQAQKTPPPPPPGENAALDSTRAIRGEHLQISVITYGPTNVVWERFGHDAIGIRDTVTGQDFAYNWGMFDFSSPGFYSRFLTGDSYYSMAPFPTGPYNKLEYIDNNRSVRTQRLALTAVERGALLEFVIWNSLDANKFYRYDYYQDNCATRVRDAIDRVLKGRLKTALDTNKTALTWRSETERVTASDPFVYPGIELALGRNADQPLSPWAASFMPERLAEALETVILKNEAGQRYRLVATDTLIYKSTRVPMPIDPPDRLAMAGLLGLTIAGLIALLADSRFKVLRGLLVAFATIWYVVGGILGTALFLAGTATKHIPYMGANTTLWQIHPVLLFAALFVPVALYRRQTTQIPRILVSICAMFSVFGLLLQFVPTFAQKSGVVLAVTVPVHIALAVAVLRTAVVVPPRRKSAAAASRAA